VNLDALTRIPGQYRPDHHLIVRVRKNSDENLRRGALREQKGSDDENRRDRDECA
jgi:hypothetical protein